MNEMNELERRLQSWVPRRPSAKLKQRLFAGPGNLPLKAPETPAFKLSWLAPAAATLFLMCVLFNQRNPAVVPSGSAGPVMAMIFSNQSAAYIPGSFQQEQNRLPADTFEWTNAGSSTSSIRSLFLQKGN